LLEILFRSHNMRRNPSKPYKTGGNRKKSTLPERPCCCCGKMFVPKTRVNKACSRPCIQKWTRKHQREQKRRREKSALAIPPFQSRPTEDIVADWLKDTETKNAETVQYRHDCETRKDSVVPVGGGATEISSTSLGRLDKPVRAKSNTPRIKR
jgi:hypothetical protein